MKQFLFDNNPILWTEYFCHFVEWVNKNALVKRGMEVIIGEKKISLYSIFELFAAFFFTLQMNYLHGRGVLPAPLWKIPWK